MYYYKRETRAYIGPSSPMDGLENSVCECDIEYLHYVQRCYEWEREGSPSSFHFSVLFFAPLARRVELFTAPLCRILWGAL